MAVIIKNLASGSLINTSLKTLGPPVAGKSWLIKSVILTNKDSLLRTMDVKVTGTGSGSTVAYIAPPGMSIAATSTIMIDTEITLQWTSTGTQETLSLQVLTMPTTGVDYVLNGIERDL